MAELNLQGFIDSHHQKCGEALRLIIALADIGSKEHKQRFDPDGIDGIPTGWRVAEAMRDIAIEAIENPNCSEDLTIYKRAFDSMAAQMICPKMTGLEMAKMQLGIN
jgi:hypothetical protein